MIKPVTLSVYLPINLEVNTGCQIIYRKILTLLWIRRLCRRHPPSIRIAQAPFRLFEYRPRTQAHRHGNLPITARAARLGLRTGRCLLELQRLRRLCSRRFRCTNSATNALRAHRCGESVWVRFFIVKFYPDSYGMATLERLDAKPSASGFKRLIG